jgi:RimJ/RimL family protein N-acetyltransferase
MAFTFSPMSQADACAILAWRYPPPYTLYNTDLDNLEDDLITLLDPVNAYYAIRDGDNQLFGFCCFGPDAQVPGGDYSDARALDVGLGMHPDCIGNGLGQTFLQAILAFAQNCFQVNRFRATIVAYNMRSLRMFTRAGFQVVQTFTSQGGRPLDFVVVSKEE